MPKKIILPREFPGATWFGEEEEKAVLRVIRNQSPFRYYGPNLVGEAKQFEREFGRFMASLPTNFDPPKEEQKFHVTAVNSGTGALEIALEALGVGCGDEVLVQGFMWIATISAIVRNRAIPVLVDSDDTLNMDPEDLRQKISDRTKVVIPVPMLGGCAKIGQIMEIVRDANSDRLLRNMFPIRVLEDNAQSLGALAKGKPGSLTPEEKGVYRIGCFGDVATFSLQINKNITAGEGGVIITKDLKIHERIQAIHNVGFAAKSDTPVDWYGDQPLTWGQGRRISEMQAAIARAQLGKLDLILGKMQESHDRIAAKLAKLDKIELRGKANDEIDGNTKSFLIFRIKYSTNMPDDEKIKQGRDIVNQLNDRGILSIFLHDYEVHVYYNIIQLLERKDVNNGCPWECPRNAFHEEHSYDRGTLPHLDALFISSIGINIPSKLSGDQEAEMCDIILDVLNNIRINRCLHL